MSLVVSPQDFKVAALAGKVEGVSQLLVVGHSLNIQTNQTPITVGFVDTLQVYAAAAESWEILSASANDAAAGTGARTVLVRYLDGDYIQQQVSVALNGITPVALAANCFRHQSTQVMTSGSGTKNAGQLTIRVAGGGATRALVALGESFSRQASFTTPAGYIAYLQSTAMAVGLTTGQTAAATIESHVLDSGGTDSIALDFTLGAPGLDLTFPAGIVIPEKTTFDYRVISVSFNGVSVSVLISGLLINTTILKWPLT